MTAAFHFRQFSVEQERAAMKVGTDGVLLGAWTQIPSVPAPRILDAGTGTGLIALMMAQRSPAAIIHALEIDPEAAAEARLNALRSPWAGRVEVLEGDFATFASPQQPYHLVVSNPPFFTETLHSPDAARAAARHASSLSPASLLSRAPGLLAPGGSLAFITPASAAMADEVTWQAALARLTLTRRVEVSASPRKAPKRILWQFRLPEDDVPAPLPQPQSLHLRDTSGNLTDAYRSLVEPFYLSIK